jgi:uncharacterized protein YukE
MRKFRAAVFAVCVLAASLRAAPARADLFGGDLVQLAAILVELLSQGATLVSQLNQLEAQVRYTRQTIEALKDVSSFGDLVAFYHAARFNYDSLVYDVNALTYSAQWVTNDFRRLFPKNQSAWQGVPASDFGRRYDAWNEELTSSALVASRAQGQIMHIQQMSAAAERALKLSQSEAGEVRQLQAIAQILGVMQSQLGTIIQLISTASRVTSNMAATTAGKEMLLQERKRRRLDGYKNPGKPPKVLTRLP